MLLGKTHPSGLFVPDPLLAHVNKVQVGRLPYETKVLAQDISGGIAETGCLPSFRDFKSPEYGGELLGCRGGRRGRRDQGAACAARGMAHHRRWRSGLHARRWIARWGETRRPVSDSRGGRGLRRAADCRGLARATRLEMRHSRVPRLNERRDMAHDDAVAPECPSCPEVQRKRGGTRSWSADPAAARLCWPTSTHAEWSRGRSPSATARLGMRGFRAWPRASRGYASGNARTVWPMPAGPA